MRTEIFTKPGAGKVRGEDTYFAKDGSFGVFDGVTGIVVPPYNDAHGRTGGEIAATAARDFLMNAGDDTEPLSMVATANEHILFLMKNAQVPLEQKEARWGTTFAHVQVENGFFKWSAIADSFILVVLKNDSVVPVYYEDHLCGILQEWMRHPDFGRKPVREVMYDANVASRRQANIKYGVLNGELDALSFIKSGTFALAEVKHIILGTDGMILPQRDPAKAPEWEYMARLFRQGGLPAIYAEVYRRVAIDPHCTKFLRLKPGTDDATGIVITI